MFDDAEIESEDEEFFLDHLDDPGEKTLVQIDSTGDECARRKKKAAASFDVPGVTRVVLDDSIRESIGAEFDESSWTTVDKDLLLEAAEALGNSSPLAALKDELETLDDQHVLIGRIVDDPHEPDEHFICLTMEARRYCETRVRRIMKRRTRKLEASVFRTPREWVSLGSEVEVEEAVPKSSRPRIRVEMKSVYPKVYRSKRFGIRSAEEADCGRSDVEPPRGIVDDLHRKRTDMAAQAVPSKTSSEAQTVPKFPRNFWTQCIAEESEIDQIDAGSGNAAELKPEPAEPSGDDDASGIAPTEGAAATVIDAVRFNASLDVYDADYPSLGDDGPGPGFVPKSRIEEVFRLRDSRARSAPASYVSPHPTAKGVFAVARSGGDDGLLGADPVSVWSLSDRLRPKFYLETLRRVEVVSFCPSEPDLLVGGCVDGRLILWNLSGKLTDELPEASTPAREEYRRATGEGGEECEAEVFRFAALSDAAAGHIDAVTDLAWLEGSEVAKGGRFRISSGDRSQLFSSSLDGTIRIWNVKLPVAPDANTDLAPDEELRPLHTVIVGPPITHLLLGPPLAGDSPSRTIRLTTVHGEYCEISWAGREEDLETPFDSESCEFVFRNAIHDGAIARCTRSPLLPDVTATFGGKIFAVWSDSTPDVPLLWKKTERRIADGIWSNRDPGGLFLATEGGIIEAWDFSVGSDSAAETRIVSGSSLIGVHGGRSAGDATVAADGDGALRGLLLSGNEQDDQSLDESFFAREINVVGELRRLLEEHHAKLAEAFEKKRKEELVLLKERERKLKAAAIKERERRELEEERAREKGSEVIGPDELRKTVQWRRAAKTAEQKMRLDRSVLLALEKPLGDLEAQRLVKLAKQAAILKERKKIFNEAASIPFPEAFPAPPAPPVVEPPEKAEERRIAIIRDFEKVSEDAEKAVLSNPFEPVFNWEKTLTSGKQRKEVSEGASFVLS